MNNFIINSADFSSFGPEIIARQMMYAFNKLCSMAGTNNQVNAYEISERLLQGQYKSPVGIIVNALGRAVNLGLFDLEFTKNTREKPVEKDVSSSYQQKLIELEGLVTKNMDQLKTNMPIETELPVLRFLAGCGFSVAAAKLKKRRQDLTRTRNHQPTAQYKTITTLPRSD